MGLEMSYSVNGPKILHNGNEIQLFGTNIVGMETQDAVIGGMWTDLSPAEYVAQIKSWGKNHVRLPIGHKTIANSDVPQGTAGIWPGSKNEKILKGKKSLDILDVLIDELEKAGIRYIFDIHELLNGRIQDLWYHEGYSEAQWLSDIAFLARRYKGKPGFVAIDVKNEPGAACTWGSGDPKTDWRLAVAKAYKESIKPNNPDICIVVEWLGPDSKNGLQQMFDNLPDIDMDKFIASGHLYGRDVWQDFGEGFKGPNYPANMKAIWDRQFGNIAKQHAFYIGEIGSHYGASEMGGTFNPLDKEYMDTIFAYFKSLGVTVHVAWWSIGADNSGSECGGLLADGGWRVVRKDKLVLMRTVKTLASYTNETAQAPIFPKPDPIPEQQVPIVISEPSPIPSTPSAEVPNVNIPDKIDLGLATIPTDFKIDLGQPLTQEQTFNIPERVTIAMEGLQAASGGQGGSATVSVPELIKLALGLPEDAIKVDQEINHIFGPIPQITLNIRQVAATPAAVDTTIVRKFAVGAKVFVALGTGINALVTGYEGVKTTCVYLNSTSGELFSVALPEAILTAR
jgi:endoglucanase